MRNCDPTIETVEKEVMLDGKEYHVKYTLITELECDPSYGADADGRRGEHACFPGDETVEDLEAWLWPYDENGEPLDEVEVTDKETLKKLEDLL